jgi:hypothetical protein
MVLYFICALGGRFSYESRSIPSVAVKEYVSEETFKSKVQDVCTRNFAWPLCFNEGKLGSVLKATNNGGLKYSSKPTLQSEGVRQILLSAKLAWVNVCWNLDKEGLGEANALGSLRNEGTLVRLVRPKVLMESSQWQRRISRGPVQISSRIWDSAGVIVVEGRRERVKGSQPLSRICDIIKRGLYEGLKFSNDSDCYIYLLKNCKFLRVLHTLYVCLLYILSMKRDFFPAHHKLNSLSNGDVFLR